MAGYRPLAPNSAKGRVFRTDLLTYSFWVALVDLLLKELWGTSEIFVLGSYHCNAIDIAIAIALIGFATEPKDGLTIIDSNGRPKAYGVAGKICISAIFVISALDLVRGSYFDIFKAFYSLRNTLYLLTVAAIVVWRRPNPNAAARLEPIMLAGSVGVILIFILRNIYGPTFGVLSTSWAMLEFLYGDQRLINVDSTVFLICSAIYFLNKSFSSPNRRDIMAFGLISLVAFAVIIASRQRTATIACIVAATTYFILNPEAARRVNIFIRIGGSISLLAGIFYLMTSDPSNLLSFLPSDFQKAVTKTKTLDARHLVWQAALERYGSWDAASKLIGNESGRPLNIYAQNQLWIFQMHNTYVGMLMQTGLLGLLAFVTLLAAGVGNAIGGLVRRVPTNDFGLTPPVALAWLTAMLIFGYSYEWRHMLSVFAFAPLANWGGARAPVPSPRARRFARPLPRARLRPTPEIAPTLTESPIGSAAPHEQTG